MNFQSLLRRTLRSITLQNTCNNSIHTNSLLFGNKKKAIGEHLYGLYPCLAAVTMNRRIIHKIYIREDKDSQDGDKNRNRELGIKSFRRYELFKYAESNNIPIVNVTSTEMDRISGDRPHQGVAMDVSPLVVQDITLKEIETDSALSVNNSPPIWLFLEEIRDPMNMGAILRSSKYFGVDRVILSPRCSRLSPVVSKASAGAMETLDIRAIASTTKFLWYCSRYWSIIGTCSPVEEENLYQTVQIGDLDELRIEKPTLILFGNEGDGLSEDIAQYCHSMLSIQPWGELPEGIDSLNVSVSAALILHKVSTVRPRNVEMADQN
ncbi:rRNA methyltransferase 1, mitochondrial [Oopsacas minuta]|uniref:rRNA methyltransferase 1, mitochondrial n=1 Tax=Oopsacas minuta TaxID=111878 RepID=A0AAV7JWA1_9METZ|nr:rRNA methyltransferase 1, mitochondrial [Oopsacas minuta]